MSDSFFMGGYLGRSRPMVIFLPDEIETTNPTDEQLRRWVRAGRVPVGRRRRELLAEGHATPAQVAARVEFYGGQCWVCGGPAEEIDHVKPIAAGGSKWPANLRPACRSCNRSKGAAWPLGAAG